jgi:hypothetical protein
MEAFCREHTSSFDSFDWLENVVSDVYGVSRVQSRMEGFQLGDKVHPRASVSIFFVVVCGVVHRSSSIIKIGATTTTTTTTRQPSSKTLPLAIISRFVVIFDLTVSKYLDENKSH